MKENNTRLVCMGREGRKNHPLRLGTETILESESEAFFNFFYNFIKNFMVEYLDNVSLK